MKNYKVYFKRINDMMVPPITIRAETLVRSIAEKGELTIGEQYTFLDEQMQILAIFPMDIINFIVVEDALRSPNLDTYFT